MRYSKWIKLSAIGLALLLIPRRGSRDANGKLNSKPNAKLNNSNKSSNSNHTNHKPSDKSNTSE